MSYDIVNNRTGNTVITGVRIVSRVEAVRLADSLNREAGTVAFGVRPNYKV